MNDRTEPVLGIRPNLAQFTLLVVVNAFVGAMVGMERSILPVMAEETFGVVASTAILSFIVVFGATKAATNYAAGVIADRLGRKPVLVLGWIVAVPVPLILMWAPSWGWIVAANALLGVSQGLAWSATVIMKIDLAGPKQRGLAMGLNEFAGYLAVGLSALATGYVAQRSGLGPAPFLLGVGYVAAGLVLSIVLVRETRHHVALESTHANEGPRIDRLEVFVRTTFRERTLSSVVQAGFVNNLNDGMAWGVFPLVFAAAGLSLETIGILAALYPATWGVGQLVTGPLSDRVGRAPMIVGGMIVQALGIGVVAMSGGFGGYATGSILLGVGTAMVYPTFLAAIGDVAGPSWRASAVGVYRLWRDMGYVAGALLSGFVADVFGMRTLLWLVAALTAASGLFYSLRARPTSTRPVIPRYR
jgi:MFS family permease